MYDIIFIGEKCTQWESLKERFPMAKHADTFENAKKKSFTKMFWAVWSDMDILDEFNFLYEVDEYSLDLIHVFKNKNYYDGICLFPKRSSVSIQELEYRTFAVKKELSISATIPRPYDIVFISYNESNADANYKVLQQRFPNAKRIQGIKGIHQAHIAAAKLCDTDMFWVVDGDATIMEDFNFDYQVPRWRKDQVFVWHSQNPINDMVYGYGGVKLLPKKETISMDISKTDMTTSISSKFNVIPRVSNITAFNTDAFNTWKSAFRECVKLASKSIDRQENTETEQRLDIWCTVGADKEFGKFSISGACAGRDYGYANKDNPNALALINDFEWLEKKFKNK